MGWLFTRDTTRSELVKERTANWSTKITGDNSSELKRIGIENAHDGEFTLNVVCLSYCYRGGPGAGNLWTVWEKKYVRTIGGEVVHTERFIGIDLIQYSKNSGWGYKDMCESMGPCQVSCPLSYLEMVPDPKTEYSTGWRDKVREWHKSRKPAFKLTLGMKVTIKDGWKFKGTSNPKPAWVQIVSLQRSVLGRDEYGNLLRLSKPCIGGIYTETPAETVSA